MILDAETYLNLIRGGAQRLRENRQTINDLNVIPIPQGDTGDNMLMTKEAGTSATGDTLGDMAKAVKILNQISATKDSLYEESCTGLNNRLDILTNDIQHAKDATHFIDRKILLYKTLALIFILSTATLSIWCFRHRGKKTEISEYMPQYEQTETLIAENTDTCDSDKDFENGKQLYEMMINEGKNIFNLSKEQRNSIVRYYESIDNEYIEQLKETYTYEKLSVNYVIVLILQHIGKDKNAIIETTGITDQALRSLKSRWEKCHL